MERALFGSESAANNATHTLASAVPELKSAVEALKDQLGSLHAQQKKLEDEVGAMVGDFSDLRYGKLGNAQLKQDVVDGLEALQATCNSKP